MKVIDLLNKIANGEEVPKKIRITDIDDRYTTHYNFFYDEDDQEYKDDELFPLGARLILDRVLNEKVEIIEDTPKVQVEMAQKEYNEYLDRKLNILKEDKKIEKLDLEDLYKLLYKEHNDYNDYMIRHIEHKALVGIKFKINEIIDRLNGEEND